MNKKQNSADLPLSLCSKPLPLVQEPTVQGDEARQQDGQAELPSTGILRILQDSPRSVNSYYQSQNQHQHYASEFSILRPPSISHTYPHTVFTHSSLAASYAPSQLPNCSLESGRAATAA